MLKPRERIVRALCVEEADEIPTFEKWFAPPTADAVLGRPSIVHCIPRQYELLAEDKLDKLLKAQLEDNIDFAKQLKWSAISVGTNPTRKYNPKAFRKISENIWRIGERIVFCNPKTQYIVEMGTSEIGRGGLEALKAHVEGLEAIKPDENLESFSVLQNTVKRLKEENLDIFIFGGAGVSIPNTADWFTLFLRCLYTYPDLIKRYMRACLKFAIVTCETAVELGCDGILSGGDLAYKHGPMISPKQYKEFVLPYVKVLSDAAHRKGAFIASASDGNLWPIIDDYLINSDIDGELELEPSAGMDLGALKERFGERRCLIGNVDCGYTLVFGTPQQITRETTECIMKAAHGGGYILQSSNAIHGGVKPENYFTMIEALRKYNRYPIPQ